jgi:hypothetical protein
LKILSTEKNGVLKSIPHGWIITSMKRRPSNWRDEIAIRFIGKSKERWLDKKRRTDH